MPGQVGPAGGGGGGITSIAMETPTGAVDGINDEFVFTSSPVQVFLQGVLQNGGDYVLNGSTVTFTIVPVVGSIISGLVAS